MDFGGPEVIITLQCCVLFVKFRIGNSSIAFGDLENMGFNVEISQISHSAA